MPKPVRKMQNQDAVDVANDIMAAFSDFFEVVPGSDVTIQRPAQGYVIVRLIPGDGSDYEEVIVDTRGAAENRYITTHRTIPRT